MIKKQAFPLRLVAICMVLISSCTTNKEILYFQDSEAFKETHVIYEENTIQPNDILSVTISAAVPEAAIPYNLGAPSTTTISNLETLKLQGYFSLPVLGKVLAKQKTVTQLEESIKELLEQGGHLINPVVMVRLLNAKVTVLGEVTRSGTFNFTEQYLTVPQALGYAGDLTINGRRDDVLLIRELDGKRQIKHIDLTTANWLENPEYMIKPNDVIVVQPNKAKVKTAGYIGNVSTIVAIASLVLSATILITR